MIWLIVTVAVFAIGASEGLLMVEDNRQHKVRIHNIVEGTESIQGER
jgi:hypothetical protein